MLYQSAKSELQSPPQRVSLLALAFEAGTVAVLALTLTWVI
jgi:hypothetical protein